MSGTVGHQDIPECKFTDYIPPEEDIRQYALEIGIDPDNEPELMWLAREGAVSSWPDGWNSYKTENGDNYFFNYLTGESIWQDPCERYYCNLVIQEREKCKQARTAGGAGAKKKKMKTEKKKGKKAKEEPKNKEVKIADYELSPRGSDRLLENIYLDVDDLGGGFQYEDSQASGKTAEPVMYCVESQANQLLMNETDGKNLSASLSISLGTRKSTADPVPSVDELSLPSSPSLISNSSSDMPKRPKLSPKTKNDKTTERHKHLTDNEVEEQLMMEKKKRICEIQDELKRAEQEEEMRLKAESEERLRAQRQEEEARFHGESKKIRQESDAMLKNLRNTMERQQEKKRMKLEADMKKETRQMDAEFKFKLETQRKELEEKFQCELDTEREKLKSQKEETLNSLKQEVKEERSRPRVEQELYDYRRNLSDVLQDVRREVEREHERELEKLKKAHMKEMDYIRENNLNEETIQRERLILTLKEVRTQLQASHNVEMEQLKLQHNVLTEKIQLENTRKENKLRDLSNDLEVRSNGLKIQQAKLQAKEEDLNKKRKRMEVEDQELESLPPLIRERDLMKEELKREREEKRQAQKLLEVTRNKAKTEEARFREENDRAKEEKETLEKKVKHLKESLDWEREEKHQAQELLSVTKDEHNKAKTEQARLKEERDKAREERDRAREEWRKTADDKYRLEQKAKLLQDSSDRLSLRVNKADGTADVRTSKLDSKPDKNTSVENGPHGDPRDSPLVLKGSPAASDNNTCDFRKYTSLNSTSLKKSGVFQERQSRKLVEQEKALQAAQTNPGRGQGITEELMESVQEISGQLNAVVGVLGSLAQTPNAVFTGPQTQADFSSAHMRSSQPSENWAPPMSNSSTNTGVKTSDDLINSRWGPIIPGVTMRQSVSNGSSLYSPYNPLSHSSSSSFGPSATEVNGQRIQDVIDSNKRWLETCCRQDTYASLTTQYRPSTNHGLVQLGLNHNTQMRVYRY